MNTTAYKRVTTPTNHYQQRTSRLGLKRIRRKKSVLNQNFFSRFLRHSFVRYGLLFLTVILLCLDIALRSGAFSKIDTAVQENGAPNHHQRHVKRRGMRIPKKLNERYKHSDIMEDVGDKSQRYAQLRKVYDEMLPEEDTQRMRAFVERLREREYNTIMADDMDYDIHNCPSEPPPNYPDAWANKDILINWPIDDTNPRELIYQGLCVFNYDTEYDKALEYRERELPFIIRNDPKVLRTTERWNQLGYLEKLIGDEDHRTEYSPNNHFMYWSNPRHKRRKPNEWKPPTEIIKMSYRKWLSHANITDENKLRPGNEHWYFRLIGCGLQDRCGTDSEYLFDELAFFQPRENDLYMSDPEEQKGIHCRFGMKGVIAENHFDGTRNMIALFGGERRYILSHPDQCENLALYPKGHPSARHSEVDWSNPDYNKFPEFEKALSNEVVLQAADVLYLPTVWFHHIVSLGLNFQCNTRSGVSDDYWDYIHDCGF